MKILAITLVTIAVIAVFAVLYLKYRLKNAPDNKDLEAALDSEVKKVTRGELSHSLVIGVYKNGNSLIKGYGTASDETAAAPIVILSNKAVDVTMLGMMLTRQVRTQSWSSQHA